MMSQCSMSLASSSVSKMSAVTYWYSPLLRSLQDVEKHIPAVLECPDDLDVSDRVPFDEIGEEF